MICFFERFILFFHIPRTSVTRMSGSENSNTAAMSASVERQTSIETIGDAPGKKLRADIENESEKGDDSSSLDSDIGNPFRPFYEAFEFCMRVSLA